MTDLVPQPPEQSKSDQLAPLEPWSFNQPVLLNKSRRVSSALVWTAVGGTSAAILWALIAPLPQTIAVQGKLQPGSTVREIEAPAPGVVSSVLVKDGERVRAGQPLLRFDQRDANSKLTAAIEIRNRLVNENTVYQVILGEIPPSGLTLNQRQQLISQRQAVAGRNSAALEDLAKSRERLAGLRTSLVTARDIAQRYRALAAQGATSQVQFLDAQAKVDDLQTLINTEEKEIARLSASLNATTGGNESDLRSDIEGNLKQIADLDKQIKEARLTLGYSLLKAPVAGIVFDISVRPGSVVRDRSEKPLLKVVPQDDLQAKVYLPNDAVGFVKPGQSADISLDSYQASDYGRLPASVLRVGSDALAPDEQVRVLGKESSGLYFPAVLKLKHQYLKVGQRRVGLQSGMSLTADIHLRNRRFISVLTGFFENKRRSLERLR
ncbi:MAG: HlyD family efflux transporter periplasmic adaptor subunit [Chitinophagaceae bacterium]|nr:HlyD family efflux transporter periplasmic adaptor subunit [Chitinophagaceae bacterium]